MEIVEEKEVYVNKWLQEVELNESVNINELLKVQKVVYDDGLVNYRLNGKPIGISDEMLEELVLKMWSNND